VIVRWQLRVASIGTRSRRDGSWDDSVNGRNSRARTRVVRNLTAACLTHEGLLLHEPLRGCWALGGCGYVGIHEFVPRVKNLSRVNSITSEALTGHLLRLHTPFSSRVAHQGVVHGSSAQKARLLLWGYMHAYALGMHGWCGGFTGNLCLPVLQPTRVLTLQSSLSSALR
jgi:hypothetical protein